MNLTKLFNRSSVIGLIDKYTAKVNVKDRIDIILTPSYYWVKRAVLEVPFTFQALKYAPSIFEGILPEGHFSYSVVKVKKEYLFFAYNADEIIKSLKDKGIEASQISGVYLAQNEFKHLSSPIACNEKDVLVLHQNTLLQVPKSLVDESTIKRSMDEIKTLSRNKITLYKSSVTHSLKELTPLMYALGAFIVLYAAQLFFTYREHAKISALPSVFKEYKLPQTLMQNNSIEKRLRSDFTAQKSFRKIVFTILQLPLSQREKISTVRYEKNTFKIIFDMQDYARLRDIELNFKKSLGKLVKVDIDKNIMTVKIK